MARKNPIRGFENILVSVTLGGVTLGAIGNNLGNLSVPTQSLVSLGIFGNTAKNVKKMFNFK